MSSIPSDLGRTRAQTKRLEQEPNEKKRKPETEAENPSKKTKPIGIKPKTSSSFRNPYGRMHVPPKYGHACFTVQTDGTIQVSQYNGLKSSESSESTQRGPLYRPLVVSPEDYDAVLQKIQPILEKAALPEPPITPPRQKTPQLDTVNTASTEELSLSTPNGSKLTSSRHCTLEQVSGEKHVTTVVLLFSPPRESEMTRFTVKKERAPKKLSFAKLPEKNNPELENSPENAKIPSIKGGKSYVIETGAHNRKTAPSQKSVMGLSAAEEMGSFAEKSKQDAQCTPEFCALLESLAKLSSEWLHCLGFSLSPESYNPQRGKNLGAGPEWVNSDMMGPEEVARHFCKLYPGAVSVTPTFKLYPGTEVVDEISYSVQIKKGDQTITLNKQIKAMSLPDKASWPSVTDAEQFKKITEAQLAGTEPSTSISLTKQPLRLLR